MPATRLAVADLDPWFVAFGRAAVAGVLAVGYLVVSGARVPRVDQIRRLAIVALGVVVGFPLFSALALVDQTSAHGAVAIACLPMATAAFAVLRASERPSLMFWVASAAGMVAVLAFIGTSGLFSGGVGIADAFLLCAVLCGALGYAEGGDVSRELGGAQTISWALIVALPVSIPLTAIWSLDLGAASVSASAWLGFGYVSLISMYLGFFVWYAGLARGGVARVGQVQLAQPVLTLVWSALLLNERVTPVMVLAAVAVLACIVWTQRARHPHHTVTR